MFDTLRMLQQGGWIMYPLALCSVIAGTIIIERCLALRRARVLPLRLVRAAEQCDSPEQAEPLRDALHGRSAPFAQLMLEVLHAARLEFAQAQERVNSAGRLQVTRLERGLTVLEVIASVSPLLGLLGTVLGMVQVFNAITAQGLGDPHILSDGIAKALITTVAGLCVAIPSLGFHSFLSKRVEDLALDLQHQATDLLVRLQTSPPGPWGR